MSIITLIPSVHSSLSIALYAYRVRAYSPPSKGMGHEEAADLLPRYEYAYVEPPSDGAAGGVGIGKA